MSNKRKTKVLSFVGMDSWQRPVYKDEDDRLWKDVNPREGFLSDRNICSAVNNYYDGEPDCPISNEYSLVFVPERITW